MHNKANILPNVIEFSLIHLGEEYKIKTYWHQYPDLRELISKKLGLTDFGECGGLGRCATCLVKIGEGNTTEVLNHVACETPIDDSLSNLKIEIIGDNLFIMDKVGRSVIGELIKSIAER